MRVRPPDMRCLKQFICLETVCDTRCQLDQHSFLLPVSLFAAPSAHASQAGAAISVHPFTFPSVVPTVGTPPAAAATASASASALVTASFTQHAPPMSFVSLVSSAPVGPRSLTSSDLAAHESKLDTCVIAERLCRHALSSLHFQDVAVAYAKLQEAMLLLKPLVE